MRTLGQHIRSAKFAARTFLAFVVVAFVVVVPTASATTGDLYVMTDTTLSEDHFGSILIFANNATLDCAGHAVIGNGTGVGINVLAAGASVANCQVEGFETGILDSSDGTRILNNVATQNGQGIRLVVATGATVSGNSANKNAFWGIIAAQGASGNVISDNTTKGNRLIGVALNSASDNWVIGNVAAENRDGFDSGFSSSFNTFRHNVATNNESTGFGFADFANSNTIDHNVSVNNGSGPNGGGFAIGPASGNIVTNNIAMHNGSSGFNVFFGSELNLFKRNHACQNFFGDAFDSSTGAGNTWIDNHFCNSALS
jgi:parallel beta-helix repeat protein